MMHGTARLGGFFIGRWLSWLVAGSRPWGSKHRFRHKAERGLRLCRIRCISADGTPASGTLIISWPSFSTVSGTAVAGGATSVKLGVNGALNVALAPNVGANPAGVLEIQDIIPADPATMIAPATVLYDSVIANASGFCTYVLVNAVNMQCSIGSTYAARIALAEVRTALPNSGYATELVGSLSEGAQCAIVGSTTLDFYPQYVPPLNTLIVASYRGWGRAVAEIVDSASIAELANGRDDGVRASVRVLKSPRARTQSDCENAALAILEEVVQPAWSGSYETWSDFLPGGAGDIFPGDEMAVNIPSRGADCSAVVREVEMEILDPAGDRSRYAIKFANDAAAPLAFEDEASATTISLHDRPPRLLRTEVGGHYLTNLTNAQITVVTSTTVTVDIGIALQSGWGIEVRVRDFGWGPANDRNLLGRFAAGLSRCHGWGGRRTIFSGSTTIPRRRAIRDTRRRCTWIIRYER